MVVLSYTQKKLLEETLDSLYKNTSYKNFKVFVVDNGSPDNHQEMVKKKFPQSRVIRVDPNRGFSGGNNVGLKAIAEEYDPDYFMLLNDDLEFFDKKWLQDMIDYCEKHKKVGAAGVQLVYPDGEFQDAGGYLHRWELQKVLTFKEGEVLDVDHFMGACVLIKKEVIKKIGGLDEIYNPFLLEDSDFFLRAKKEGYSIRVLTGVKVIHKKSKTVGSLPNSKHLSARFKNEMIFAIRHMSLRDALFRIFIFAPLVAIFKKKRDQEKLSNWRNYYIRKKAFQNVFLLLGAYGKNIFNLPRIFGKNRSMIYPQTNT